MSLISIQGLKDTANAILLTTAILDLLITKTWIPTIAFAALYYHTENEQNRQIQLENQIILQEINTQLQQAKIRDGKP